MKYIIEFLNTYSIQIIHTILISIISYISIETKRIYKKHTQDLTKRQVINTVCKAINQIYPHLSGKEKLNKTIINTKQILKEKGIPINDLELRMYIESYINESGVIS